MIINIKNYVNFLIKHELNPNQFFVIYCIATNNQSELERLRGSSKFSFLTEGDKQTLLNSPFLIPIGVPDEVGLTRYDISKGFIPTHKCREELFFLDDTIYKELYEEYPIAINVKGTLYPARKDNEDLLNLYYKQIKFSPELHNEVILLLRWGIENDKLNCGMEKFIQNKTWEFFKFLKDGGETKMELNESI